MFTKTMSALATLAVFLICLGSASVLLPETAVAGNTKVDVCHLPPGNPENYHTISIGEKALPAHVAHLDLTGACNEFCADFCDDGDACTVDDSGDCEQNGCPVDREPVDCDDGLFCTVDSCDSSSGCLHVPVTCTPPDMCTVAFCSEDAQGCAFTPRTDCEFGCAPDSGCLPEPEPVCPCFDAQDLATGGTASSFCDLPLADGSAIFFDDGSVACSGAEGCTAFDNGDGTFTSVRGCGIITTSVIEIRPASQTDDPISVDEDNACRQVISDFCSGAAAPASADAPSSDSSGDPAADGLLPIIVE